MARAARPTRSRPLLPSPPRRHFSSNSSSLEAVAAAAGCCPIRTGTRGTRCATNTCGRRSRAWPIRCVKKSKTNFMNARIFFCLKFLSFPPCLSTLCCSLYQYPHPLTFTLHLSLCIFSLCLSVSLSLSLFLFSLSHPLTLYHPLTFSPHTAAGGRQVPHRGSRHARRRTRRRAPHRPRSRAHGRLRHVMVVVRWDSNIATASKN